MRRSILWTVLGFSALPTLALGQTKPTITCTLEVADARLGLDDLTDEGNARFINLRWTATFAPTVSYEYEVTYDRPSTAEQPNQVRVTLDRTTASGEPNGPQITGVATQVSIHPRQVLEGKLPSSGTTYDDATRDLIVKVYPSSDPDNINTYGTCNFKFEFDTKPPPAPTLERLVPGEDNLKAYWLAPSAVTDVKGYDVGYCANVPLEVCTATAAASSTCETPTVFGVSDETTTDLQVSGLTNDQCTVVRVRARDDFENVGEWSNAVAGTPTEVTDFFELYRQQGGQEEGGFCFIATAAYGSYAHPAVRALRLFRDQVLKRSPVGTGLVFAYYRISPPMADFIRGRPELQELTRVVLVPVALLGLLLVALPFFGAGVIAWRVLRRRRVALGLVALLILLPSAAKAEFSSSRPPSDYGKVGLGFEFKGGPYLPAVATDTNVDAFGRIFEATPNALYSLGMELQLYRGFGSLGVGGNFGFMQFVGKSFFGGTNERSSDTTVFNLLPLKLHAVYRFDWLIENTPIPLVPYARGGLAYYIWWATTGTGDISRVPVEGQDDLIGRGGKLGLAGSLGVAVMLNFIDPHSARNLQASTGIRGTYLFAEVEGAQVDGFGGSGFNLSDFTWNLGIFLEL
jgi:hypothetical protein